MKKTALYVILFLFAALLWNASVWSGDMAFHVDGDAIDAPLGFMLATLFAGGGTLLGFFITVVVMVVLAVAFAGVGVILLGSLAIVTLCLALAVSPLLLPLLVPLAIVWYLASRSRRVALDKPAAA